MQAPDRPAREGLGRALDALIDLLGRERGRLGRLPAELPSLLHAGLRASGWSAAELARTFGFATEEAAGERTGRASVPLPLWLDEVVRLTSGSGGPLPRPPGGPVTGVLWLGPERAFSWSSDGSGQVWDLADGRLEQSVRLHAGAITGAHVVDPERRLLATASMDSTVGLVDLGSGIVRRLRGHGGPVLGVLAPPARRGEPPGLVSWSADGTVRLWDPETGASRGRVAAHRGAVRSLILLDPDRDAGAPGLATGGDDGWLRLWRLPTASGSAVAEDPVLVAETRGHQAPVTALLELPLSERAFGVLPNALVSGSEDTTVGLWRLPARTLGSAETGPFELIARLEGHRLGVTDLAWTGGDPLVSASLDRTLIAWSLAEKRVLARFEEHRGAVTACTVEKGDLISASADGTVGIRRVLTGPPVAGSAEPVEAPRPLAGHRLAVRALAVEPEGRRLLTASDDRTLRLWDLEAGVALGALTGRRPAWGRPVALGGGRVLCLAGSALRIVDVATGEVTDAGSKEPVEGLAEAPSPTSGPGASFPAPRVLLWGHGRLELREPPPGPTSFPPERAASHEDRENRPVRGAALDSTGEWVATWGDDEEIEVRRRRGTELARAWLYRSHTDRVSFCRFLPDSPRLLSASWDGTLRLWRLDRPGFDTLEGHRGRILACAVDPDGKRALSAATDRTLRAWDLSALAPAGVVEGVPELVTALLAGSWGFPSMAGTADGELLLVDLDAAADPPILRRQAHEGALHDLAAIATGFRGSRIVASCGDDGAVRTWDPRSGEPLGTAWAELPLRSLTWLPEIQRLVAQDELGSLWSFRLSEDKTRFQAAS